MKKLFLLLLVAFTCVAANAQLVTSTTVTKQKKAPCSWKSELVN